MNVRESYDSAATAYTEHLARELQHKPLDRHLLNRFAEDTRGRVRVVDLGCGPGHVSGYLSEHGVAVAGIDLSREMIRCARQLNPALEFQVGDMRNLPCRTASHAGLVAFYSIVHFEAAELTPVMLEMRRILTPGGLALLSFHIGHDVIHLDDLFGAPVSLDFRFHAPDNVTAALRAARFAVIEHVEREPYPDVEYQSRRCYLLAKAV